MIAAEDVEAAAALIAEFVGLRATAATEARLAAGVERRCAARRVGIGHYLSVLAADSAERQALVDVVTVPETSWFRDPDHLDVVVRELAGRGAPVHVWSAGCAGGQEPYSIVMALVERGVDVRVVATDIATPAVERAVAATYRDHELRGLDAERRGRWFRRTDDGWRLDPAIRDRVTVRQSNLLADSAPAPGWFDAVLCRHVLIYLRRDRIAVCLSRFRDALAPGGLLLVGGSESISGIDHGFEAERKGNVFVHRRRAAAPVPLPDAVPPGAAASAVVGLRETGEAAVRDGRLADAVVAFRQAAYVDPGDPVTYLELGLALEAGGDVPAGRRAYLASRHALDRCGTDATAVLDRLEGWSLETLRAVLDIKLNVQGARS